MKAVIQRVAHASVTVEEAVVGRIGQGLMVLLGVAKGDTEEDGRYMAEKIRTLRIFPDEAGKMNRSLTDVGGAVLLVSQFTLLGGTTTGRRPSFDEAAPPDEARRLYELVSEELRRQGTVVETGVFAAYMRVALLNDGPVTFIVNSRETRR
ncbi:D-aminoacyl-tRNA deacylase [Candidatus Nitrospira inopinata]|jgi:D-tyrosyl-tRNA(Tyr) deacylase|uniref:D-aminoacyl-tRNA deacylase n=1 Tax=Candidatus Nitrospira inopinata TaxID=1715989 RepID=A0A0S4KR28_9BACT|nr:D-aminoacyl-tRNA deacylase [Candidatus Nitrospira inopinata]CUQ66437.1 D-tyr-tRNA(Tyr) deacylase [Candidatus Nitrospira inopinata]